MQLPDKGWRASHDLTHAPFKVRAPVNQKGAYKLPSTFKTIGALLTLKLMFWAPNRPSFWYGTRGKVGA